MFLDLETFLIPLFKIVLCLMCLVIMLSLEGHIQITSTTSGKSIIKLNLGGLVKNIVFRWKLFGLARDVRYMYLILKLNFQQARRLILTYRRRK